MSNHKVTAWGFTLAYCALMAGLAILTMPHTDGWRVEVGTYLLLPCLLIATAMVLYARFRQDDSSIY